MQKPENFPGASPLDPANALASPEALGLQPQTPDLKVPRGTFYLSHLPDTSTRSDRASESKIGSLETVYGTLKIDVTCVNEISELCYLSKSVRTQFLDPSEQALIFDENFPIKKFCV